MTTSKRTIEVFTAGCPACDETVQLVQTIACESCEVTVLDMNDTQIAERAKELGIRTVPAVVINGQLSSCCAGSGPSEQVLRDTGIGQSL